LAIGSLDDNRGIADRSDGPGPFLGEPCNGAGPWSGAWL
jgi:hypothetical protein